MRPIGASELLDTDDPDHAHARTRRIGAGDRDASACSVHNNGPDAHDRAAGHAVRRRAEHPDPVRPARRVAHGQTRRAAAPTSTVAEPALWSPAAPNLYTLSLAVGQREQLLRARRAAPADLARRAHVPQRPPAAAARRLDPGGRPGPRRRADARRPGHARRRAEGDRRQRRALPAPARPGAARTPRRRRHPRLAGRRPGRRRRQLVLDHAARWSAKPSSRRAPPCSPPQLHPSIFAWNLVDEVAGNGRDAAEVQLRAATRPAGCTPTTPTRMVAVDVWGDHPPTQRRPAVLRTSTPSPRPTTPAGMTRRTTPPRSCSALMRARLRARWSSTFAGKVL